ncbi:MAG TPA: CRISPR-associated protein Cas4 [Firmicutes bacterium]|nr:CRISPR-associated protein Cas4 [Candidatus Fermentithermobacillaceae bacterium]
MIHTEQKNFVPGRPAKVPPPLHGLSEPLRVSDIRQYVYCPRIVYFNYVIPVPRVTTVKMEEGLRSHTEFSELESRRTLAKYGLEEGTREFRVQLQSHRLGIAGRLDLLITTASNVYPVEFKDTHGNPGLHHKYQLVAYALMAEEARGKPAKAGFIYVIPGKKIFKITIDESARMFTQKIISAMVNIIRTGTMPQRTRWGGRCRGCEFRNYCRDA